MRRQYATTLRRHESTGGRSSSSASPAAPGPSSRRAGGTAATRSAPTSWHGVPVSAVVERCVPRATARYIEFVSFDAGYSNGWDWASALHPQTILAYGMNDNPIPAAHGAPLRLYSPIKLGYKLTKYLVS